MAGEEKSGRGLHKSRIDRTLLWAWGANSHGQLGTGYVNEKVIPSNQPVPVGFGYDAIKDVGGGGGFSFILTEYGRILTTGNNDKGQLGQGNMVKNLTVYSHCHQLSHVKIVKVAAGWDFMLGLSDTGCLLSWGSNMFAQLGRTLPEGANYDALPGQVEGCVQEQQIDISAGLRHGLSLSVQVPSGEKPVHVLAGMYHSGILTETGTILLWGCNKFGQCGRDPDVSQTVLLPSKVTFPTLKDGDSSEVVSVTSGWSHIIACTGSGTVYSWGRADLGQLGRQCDKSYDHVPKLVTGLPLVKHHSCGSEHTLAVTVSGHLYSWGWNEHSICGPENEENVLQPQQIPLFLDKHVISVACGAGHSFCIIAGPTVYCPATDADKELDRS